MHQLFGLFLILLASGWCGSAMAENHQGDTHSLSSNPPGQLSEALPLAELNEYDAAGVTIRGIDLVNPDVDMDFLKVAAGQFTGDRQTRALTDLLDYLAAKHRSGTLEQFCDDLEVKSNEFSRISATSNARRIVLEGISSHILSIDAAANKRDAVAFSSGPKQVWIDGVQMSGDHFGLSELDALQIMARHPKTPDDLAVAAQGMRNFLLTLNSDWILIDNIELICSGEYSKTELRLEGWLEHNTDLDEGCDPKLYFGRIEHESPQLNTRMMEFLIGKGVRDFYLNCVNVSSFIENVHLGKLEVLDSRISFLSVENSTLEQVSVSSSVGHGPISLLDSSVSGAVSIASFESDGFISLTRARVEGRVDITDVRVTSIGLDEAVPVRGLSISDVVGSDFLNMTAMRSEGFITVTQSSFKQSISLARAELGDGLSITKFKTAGFANLQGLRTQGAVNLVDVEFAHSLTLKSASLEEGLTISGMKTMGFGNFEGLRSQGRLEISDGDFGVLPELDESPIDDSIERNTLYMRSVQVADAVQLKNVRVAGSFSLTNSQAASVQLYNVQISRDLILAATQVAGPLLVGSNGVGIVVGNDFVLSATSANSLQIVHAYVGGTLDLGRVEVETRLYLQHTVALERIYSVGSSADSLDMRGVASPRIELTGNQFERGVDFHSVVSELVLADRVEASFLRFNTPDEAEEYVSAPLVTPSTGSCFEHDRARTPTKVDFRLAEGDRVALGIQPGAAGCIGTLRASGIQVGGDVFVAGNLLAMVDLSTAAIGGRLELAGNYSRFKPETCVIARGLRADSIVYDASTGDSAMGPRPPDIIDLFGAEFRILTASQPKPASRLDWHQVEDSIAPFFGSVRYRCDAQSGYTTNEGGSARRDYQPAVYDALAAGLERMGDYDQARKVRIIKNREFAANLSAVDGWDQVSLALTRLVYWLADNVSGYGYDNLKAVLWLTGLTLIGLILGWIGEARLAFALSPIANGTAAIREHVNSLFTLARKILSQGWRDARSSRIAPLIAALDSLGGKIRQFWPAQHIAGDAALENEGNRKSRKGVPEDRPVGSPTRPGLAFSIDRSIPSLALDTAFGGHAGLGPYLSAWFYTQRMLSFIILALMVASAFNVFQ